MYCSICGKELPKGAVFCPECGERQVNGLCCPRCGSAIDDDSLWCSSCGYRLGADEKTAPESRAAKPAPETRPKVVYVEKPTETRVVYQEDPRAVNKWVAFLLCFFLGPVGAHRYYEGKIGLGILYTFTGGLFGIGWLVDLIRILFKPNPYYP